MHFILKIKKKKKKHFKEKASSLNRFINEWKNYNPQSPKKSRRFVCSHNQRKFQQMTLD